MLAAILAAAALAAPFGEAPPTTVTSESPTCMQPTGRPGELFAMTDRGVRLLGAGPGGLTLGETLSSDVTGRCAAVALAPSGAGVVACCFDRRPPAAIFRDPGGAWSPAVEIAPDDSLLVADIATAVSDQGAALVAWVERAPDGQALAVKAVRRSPGATPGEVEVLGDTTGTGTLDVGIAADGEAFVAWTGPTSESRRDITVAIAPPGGPFTTTRLAQVSRHARPSLAVAPDGHALVAYSDGQAVQVAERAPGGTFGAPTRVAELKDPLAANTKAELGADGRALVAWSGVATGGVYLVTRAPGAGFSATTTLTPGEPKMGFDVFLNEQFGGLGDWDWGGAELSTALAADGRGAVAWIDPRPQTHTAKLAVTAFDGGAAVIRTAGGGLRSAYYARAIQLADGTPALTYVDGFSDTGFRVRVAAEGASTPEPALPRVRLRRPAKTTLAGDRAQLRVPVECSGPCELRATLTGTVAGASGLFLEKGGKGTLLFVALDDRSDHDRRGRVRVRVSYSGPGGKRVRSTSLVFEVNRTGLHPRPTARIVGLRAVRHGTSIRVTWRTSRPVEGGMLAQVVGRATRSRFEDPLVYGETSKGGRAFAVTLRNAARVKYVTLYNYVAEPETSVVRVR
jgi:hypothetical protein